MAATRLLSFIIPALNEERAMEFTLDLVPRRALEGAGWGSEVVVVDNGSTDKTVEIARSKGARVVVEPQRGYGRALKRGIAASRGEAFCTGDADGTYPFDEAPGLLELMERERLDFVTTDRFASLDPAAMPLLNRAGNAALSLLVRGLYGLPLRDSQSGMWLCRRELYERLRVRSDGMAFSQEFKIEAIWYAGARWRERPISYRTRLGTTKLRAFRDGALNLAALARKRFLR